MLDVIQNSFNLNLSVLYIWGMYTRGKPTMSYKIRGLLFLIFCVTPIPLFTMLHYLLEKEFDIEDIKYDAPHHAQLCCCFLKFTLFIIKRNRIRECIGYFNSHKFTFMTKTQKEILKEAATTSQRNTFAFLVCCIAGLLGYAAKPLFGEEKKLPSQIWLPFRVTNGSLQFYIVYCSMATNVGILAFGTGLIDPLMAGLAHFATSHIKILNDQLENLDLYVTNKDVKKNYTVDEMFYRRIIELVNYHNTILNFIKEIEACFSWTFFGQIGGSVFVICFICIQLIEIKTVDYFAFYLISSFVVVIAQITFYCYYGTELTEETNRITKSIYMGKWYNYNTKCKKSLVILMQRSQKPLAISAGKLLDLSLATLAMIIRRSYSLIAVLQNY